MTQKIFDTDNEEDMKLLWSILPDEALIIKKDVMGCQVWETKKEIGYTLEMLKINWHDKTEITRPDNYEDMIGCVGWFWNGIKRPSTPTLSVLWKVDGDIFLTVKDAWFEHFIPAKKSELKFYGD